MLLVCVRYIISRTIMLVFSQARGLYLPKGRELAWAWLQRTVDAGDRQRGLW